MSPVRILLAAAALAVGGAAQAGSLADLRIINRATGESLPVYSHEGRFYVAGRPGDRYAVQVANRSGGRILTVVSVDGVNVVSGETAGPQQGGYVLAPYQSYEINGWRKSSNEIAAFYFTTLADSYAARTDRPANVGVIGVAVFREWTPPPRPRPPVQPMPYPHAPEMRSQNQGAASAPADAEIRDQKAPLPPGEPGAAPRRLEERIGTGHGERERSDVTHTQFRRASPTPAEMLTIYYDSRENLAARGIIPAAPWAGEPRPFPQMRFVPDPRS